MDSDVKTAIVLGSSVGLGFGLFCLGYSYFYRRRKPYVGGVVTSLHHYPVKSCAGIDLSEAEVKRFGLHFDRNWVLVNSKGIVLTQRQLPKMALIQPSFEGSDFLCLDAPGMSRIKINVEMEGDEETKATIDMFGVSCEGYYCGDEISEWLSMFLGKTGIRLYSGRSKDLKKQKLTDDPNWGDEAKEGEETVYPDTAPAMLMSGASLAAVNSHLENTLTMKSFRPNIVVKGCRAYEEDSWKVILIGDVLMRKLAPCTRCYLTTVDPVAGTRNPTDEPFKTLKRIRMPEDRDKRCGTSPMLGDHFVISQIGKMKIGDEVFVLK